METRELVEILAAFGLIAGYHVLVWRDSRRATIQALAQPARAAWGRHITGDPGRAVLLGMRGYYLAIPLTLWLFGPEWLLGGAVLLVALLLLFEYLRSIDVVRDAAEELAPAVSPPTDRNSPAA